MPCIRHGAGLLFFPGGVSATRKRLQLLFCPTPKASTGLYSSVSVNLTHSSAHNTAATQAAYTHLHPAGWHTVKRYTCTDTRYYRRAGRCTGQRSPPPIIIRYIRVRPVIDPCPAVQHGADHASGSGSAHPVQGSARRLEIWHRVNLAPSTRCGSPAARVRWAARNHWRLPPHLFSGFRPIANRGQQ